MWARKWPKLGLVWKFEMGQDECLGPREQSSMKEMILGHRLSRGPLTGKKRVSCGLVPSLGGGYH